MTDESDQSYPLHIDTLLDRALGPEGYYGVFTANMHTDTAVHPGSEAIVASAQSRGVPIVSAQQMLDWLDGRNGSSFANLTWNGTTLSFTVSVGAGANGLQMLVPAQAAVGPITGVTRNGAPVGYTLQTVKGVSYATVTAAAGSYQVQYAVDTTPPAISGLTAAAGSTSATITWTTNEPATTRVNFGTSAAALNQSATSSGLTHLALGRLEWPDPGDAVLLPGDVRGRRRQQHHAARLARDLHHVGRAAAGHHRDRRDLGRLRWRQRRCRDLSDDHRGR